MDEEKTEEGICITLGEEIGRRDRSILGGDKQR